MNFCFVINDYYVDKALVLLTSIFMNNPQNHQFFILTNELKESNLSILRKYIENYKSLLKVYEVNDKCLDGVPLKRRDFNKTPYYKLLFLEYLPKDLDRVLYMDVDMIVNGDLTPLYNLNLNTKPFAAVPDPLINKRDKEYLLRMNINESKGEKYFNSGLILLNLSVYRKLYSLNSALKYIEINGKNFKFHDQEVLNGLFGNNYLQVSEEYNYLTVYRSIKDLISYIFGSQMKNKNKIKVFHYANPTKPWKKNYIGKYEEIFWQYAKVSPSYNQLANYEKNNILEQFKALWATLRRKLHAN